MSEKTTKAGRYVVPSLLDTDLYKFTQQQAVLEKFPNAIAEFRFTNRRPEDKFSQKFAENLHSALQEFKHLQLTGEELKFLKAKCPYLKLSYLEYLSNYRYDPSEVEAVVNNGELKIVIKGPWHRTIMWEVPLMAVISEIYFQDKPVDFGDLRKRTRAKSERLSTCPECKFADFGTRRRRSYLVHEAVVEEFAKNNTGNFTGTSNVHLARKYDVAPIGTMAHEWIMAISALVGLRHANRFALELWNDVYKGELGIALPDTFGSESFFNDFSRELAKLFDGVRHDSGDPIEFADKIIAHYKKLKIDPPSKTIVFSDGLDVEKALKIASHCVLKIRSAFGIGTHFTNDFPDAQALNMVIKLYAIDGIHVAKLSDDVGKSTGHPDAVRIANYVHRNIPLGG